MPFLDSVGLFRVGGRFHYAPIASNVQHSMFLPKKSNLTNLIIDSYHKTYFPVGLKMLSSILKSTYVGLFPLEASLGRMAVKVFNKFNVRPICIQPMIGDLPKIRYRGGYPFFNVGVNFGGS